MTTVAGTDTQMGRGGEGRERGEGKKNGEGPKEEGKRHSQDSIGKYYSYRNTYRTWWEPT